MKATKSPSSKQKPLVDLRAPLRVRAYRGKFVPFEVTKHLDVKALKRAKKASFECGTVEAAGMKYTVVADVSDGKLVALKPIACEGCAPQRRRSAKRPDRAQLRETMQLVRERLADKGVDPRPQPTALRISPRLGFQIPIGPIIIIIGDPAPGGIFDICFERWDGNQLCWWCLLGASGCISFG